ncbi:uncharacterized protein LOC34620309 [Cyclospora cayetanensis]|uniref:Uncharacterized protein LOC34620309 n=1 Tax=Cyclospora cayetanensis TaxID=88456 RepID=A0A6P6RYD0_9EIME|nr:uncharacterized protein LOC34620309 [Cyclospora cayetanensis]
MGLSLRFGAFLALCASSEFAERAEGLGIQSELTCSRPQGEGIISLDRGSPTCSYVPGVPLGTSSNKKTSSSLQDLSDQGGTKASFVELVSLTRRRDELFSLALSSVLVVVCSRDGLLEVRNVADTSNVVLFRTAHAAPVISLTVFPKGDDFAVLTTDEAGNALVHILNATRSESSETPTRGGSSAAETRTPGRVLIEPLGLSITPAETFRVSPGGSQRHNCVSAATIKGERMVLVGGSSGVVSGVLKASVRVTNEEGGILHLAHSAGFTVFATRTCIGHINPFATHATGKLSCIGASFPIVSFALDPRKSGRVAVSLADGQVLYLDLKTWSSEQTLTTACRGMGIMLWCETSSLTVSISCYFLLYDSFAFVWTALILLLAKSTWGLARKRCGENGDSSRKGLVASSSALLCTPRAVGAAVAAPGASTATGRVGSSAFKIGKGPVSCSSCLYIAAQFKPYVTDRTAPSLVYTASFIFLLSSDQRIQAHTLTHAFPSLSLGSTTSHPPPVPGFIVDSLPQEMSRGEILTPPSTPGVTPPSIYLSVDAGGGSPQGTTLGASRAQWFFHLSYPSSCVACAAAAADILCLCRV